MKSSRFSEEQIVGILKEQEARMSTALSVVPYGSSFLPTMPLTHEIHDTAGPGESQEALRRRGRPRDRPLLQRQPQHDF